MSYLRILTRWYLNCYRALNDFSQMPVPRDANSAASFHTPRAEKVKKASYERSKNAWRTCDLPCYLCRRGPPARNLHVTFFSLPPTSLSPFFPPSLPPTSVSSPPGHGPLPPLRPADQSRADLWLGRTLQMDTFVLLFGAWRRAWSYLRWYHLTVGEKLPLNSVTTFYIISRGISCVSTCTLRQLQLFLL